MLSIKYDCKHYIIYLYLMSVIVIQHKIKKNEYLIKLPENHNIFYQMSEFL